MNKISKVFFTIECNKDLVEAEVDLRFLGTWEHVVIFHGIHWARVLSEVELSHVTDTFYARGIIVWGWTWMSEIFLGICYDRGHSVQRDT